MSGSLMLSSPFSTWPAAWYANCASPSTVSVRSYQPLTRVSDQLLAPQSPGPSSTLDAPWSPATTPLNAR